jgi:5'-3' exonuclease
MPAEALVLVDASAAIFPVYFAAGDRHRDDAGAAAGARVGWLDRLLRYRAALPPGARLGVAFDEALGTGFRHALDPAYKAHRPLADPALQAELQQCRAMTRALGIPESASRRFEADDLLALAAARGRPRPLVLVSGDKDLLQLLRPGDLRWRPDRAGPESYDAVRAALGFAPEAMAHYLALVGDSSDGIAGVPGVGTVTATRLLQRFPSLAALYGALDHEGEAALAGLPRSARLAAQLLAGRAQAEHALTLTRLDGPVPRAFDPARVAPPPLSAERVGEALRLGGLLRYRSRFLAHLPERP